MNILKIKSRIKSRIKSPNKKYIFSFDEKHYDHHSRKDAAIFHHVDVSDRRYYSEKFQDLNPLFPFGNASIDRIHDSLKSVKNLTQVYSNDEVFLKEIKNKFPNINTLPLPPTLRECLLEIKTHLNSINVEDYKLGYQKANDLHDRLGDHPEILNILAKFRKKLSLYDVKTKELFLKAVEVDSRPKESHLWNALDYIFEVYGVCPDVMKLADTISKHHRSKLKVHKIIKLASIMSDAGYPLKALNYVDMALKRDSSKALKSRYLGLNAAIGLIDKEHAYFSIKEYELYQRIKSNTYDFVEYLKLNIESFSIIGNSPKELGKRKGGIIDSKDVIIRFNNFSQDASFYDDYGSKVNVWVKAGSFRETKRKDVRQMDFVVISTNNPFYRSPTGMDLFSELDSEGVKVCIVPPDIVQNTLQKIESPPSAGITILNLLSQISKNLPEDSIHGFSFVDQKNGQSRHYFSAHEEKKNNARHNWENEYNLYKQIAYNNA